MVIRHGHHKKKDFVDALEIVRHGESYADLVRTSSVPLRTVFKKAEDKKSGIPIERGTPGTKPAISADLESHLMEWVAAMQRVGLPVFLIEIMKRATLIFYALQERTKTSQSTQLTYGWYSRFLVHHPVLVPRTAQSIGEVRNTVEM